MGQPLCPAPLTSRAERGGRTTSVGKLFPLCADLLLKRLCLPPCGRDLLLDVGSRRHDCGVVASRVLEVEV